MRVVDLGGLDDSNDVTLVHENNISPFFPHSEGFIQINCHAFDAQSIFVESSDDGTSWSMVHRNIGIPVEATDRSYTVPFNKMGRYIRCRGVNVASGTAECFLIGG